MDFMRHYSRHLVMAVLVLGAILAPRTGATAPEANALVVDDFEDGDTNTMVGGRWQSFNSANDPNALVPLILSEGGQKYVSFSGRLPESTAGAVWMGAFCDLSEEGPRDLAAYEYLSFRVRSDASGVYRVRIEDSTAKENSTNIPFPVNEEWSDVSIPLRSFATGFRRAKCITFTRSEDRAGATFVLMLDDVRFTTATGKMTKVLENVKLPWSSSLNVAWTEATKARKPLVLYFTSDVGPRCRQFEQDTMAKPEFSALGDQFSWLMVDVSSSANRDLTRRFGIVKVPALVVVDAATKDSITILPDSVGNDLAPKLVTVANQWKTRPATTPVAIKEGSPSVLIEDFSDGNMLNRVGGMWSTFSRGDHGDVRGLLILQKDGNYAYEVTGQLPAADDGVSWGGVYCDLSRDRGTPRNLNGFSTLEFTASSSRIATYVVRIENADLQHNSTPVPFDVGPQPKKITIPLSSFTTGVDQARTIVWLPSVSMPGEIFHLVLDDVRINR